MESVHILQSMKNRKMQFLNSKMSNGKKKDLNFGKEEKKNKYPRQPNG